MPCKRDPLAAGDRQIILVTHTVPFLELRDFSKEQDIVSQFCRAYLGSKTITEEISLYAAQIDLLVCGHSGPRVGPTEIHGMTAINIGSGYGNPLSFIYPL